MKKALLLLTATLLFACNKNEAPPVKTAPSVFDATTLTTQLAALSENAVRKQSNKGQNAKFLRFLKIFCADVLGGLSGAAQGSAFGPAGTVIGGVAGAVAGSITAAQSYATSVEAPGNFTGTLQKASFGEVNLYVDQDAAKQNPYSYYGTFHNTVLANLTHDFTGKPRDEFNHGLIIESLQKDRDFQPYYVALREAGGDFTLGNYSKATYYFTNLEDNEEQPHYSRTITNMVNDRVIPSYMAPIYNTYFSTMDQLTTYRDQEAYLSSYESAITKSDAPEEDKALILKTLAVARYSMSFWYYVANIEQ